MPGQSQIWTFIFPLAGESCERSSVINTIVFLAATYCTRWTKYVAQGSGKSREVEHQEKWNIKRSGTSGEMENLGK